MDLNKGKSIMLAGGVLSAIMVALFVPAFVAAPALTNNGTNESMVLDGRICVQLTDTATGDLKQEVCKHNLITDAGKELWGDQLFNAATGVTSAGVVNKVALGTGTTDPADGDTALQTELVDGAYARKTVAAPTYDDATNVVTISASWNEAFACACTETGTFDATTTGNMLSRAEYSVVNKGTGDTLTIVWTYDLG